MRFEKFIKLTLPEKIRTVVVKKESLFVLQEGKEGKTNVPTGVNLTHL